MTEYRVCSNCKKMTSDWVSSVTFDKYMQIGKYTHCEKCRKKLKK